MSSYDDIINKQSALVDAVKAIQANFKKDGASRKMTLEYHDERLRKLDNYWKEFQNNDSKLAILNPEKTGEYYESQVFLKLYTYLVETKEMINLSRQKLKKIINTEEQKLRSELEKQKQDQEEAGGSGDNPFSQILTQQFNKPTYSSDSQNHRLVELLNEQKSNIKAFERTLKNLNIENITERWQLEDKIKNITGRWENIDRLYWKLDNMIENKIEYEQDYNRLENMYEIAKGLINTKIWNSNHQEKSTPKIELPTFNGHFSQWTTFKDLYIETVHSNTFISKAQKMQHLKSKLRGDAERLVQHLSISADNYDTCWFLLLQRYDNIRLLFTYHANELLNQPTIQQPNAFAIKRMHDITLENLNAISNLNIETTNWDPLLIHILIQKLDNTTRQAFNESLNNPREVPTLTEFLNFLENKFLALETSNNKTPKYNYEKTSASNASISTSNNVPYNKKIQPNFNFNNKARASNSFFNSIIVCPNCNQQHGLYSCKQFLDMSSKDRLQVANRLKVCKNCLFSHNGNKCTSNKKCKLCNKNHSTLLHEAMTPVEEKININGNQPLTHHLSNDNLNEVLLATAQINVKTLSGQYIKMRALLDQGSQVSIISEDACQRLQLKRQKMDAVISGVGSLSSNKCKGQVELNFQSLMGGETLITYALVINSLTSKLPNRSFSRNNLEHLDHIQLADPEFNISKNIDILLGADVYSEILMSGIIKTETSSVVAQQTQLGWVIYGKQKTFKCHVTINEIEDISKFWEQEEVQENTKEQQSSICEPFYKQTTVRLSNGQYQVRLPLKPNIQQELGTSKTQAIAQFKQLERRMETNTDFGNQYKDFITEYRNMNHMKTSYNVGGKLQYFLPHHGIIREDAVTTKLRVVFNASAKTSTKKSLNDVMESGPNLQADLQTLIIKWRQYKYVFTADLEKMYRFIAVHPDDQLLQKIVWRDTPHQHIQEYQLCTVTYGTKAAPYLAIRTLKQLAADEGDNFPKAKLVLLNCFFMDDALFGAHNISEAREIRDQLNQLLQKATFNLRKWTSNEPSLLSDLPEEKRSPLCFNFTETQTSKALGLAWDPKTDTFSFSSKLQNKETPTSTKRQILKDISTLFDPLGWLSPITIKAKILFQTLWINNLQWDETVSEAIEKEWILLRNELKSLECFKIKRWVGTTEQISNMELHAFCDASEKAYACVVYSLTKTNENNIEVNLIAAKTKVAPLRKQQTLPRLELCGAQLLTKLVKKITEAFQRDDIKITAWTDSMVVLGWINGDLNRWNTYVANRVRDITTNIPAENWRHVKSEQNPADCASRGLLPSQLAKFGLWWEGPQWLKGKIPVKTTFKQDIRIEAKSFTTTTYQDINIITLILNKQSNMCKAVRVLAMVLRFIALARTKKISEVHLTMNEIRAARLIIIKHIQTEFFEQELDSLKKSNKVMKNSKILKLNPTLDENGILRVNGRLKYSYLPEKTKNPIIIPQTSRLTELLIDETHKQTLHGGARLTLATLRQSYWILGGNTTVKKYLRKCTKCCRYNARTQQQLMGNLPVYRTTPAPPFYHTGVDFTGFVELKLNKGRGVRTSKGYVAVFVCMVTRAVHLELATDLSTPTFIMALKRMVARRGCPKFLYSDNGTNFVGAEKELFKQLKMAQTINSELSNNEITAMGIEWKFNAPSWPSAGGIWEAAVKSMKYHLKRVLGEQKLTFEEFQTLLTQIEACLNSRPIVPLSEDVEDMEVLTPGHFLIGRPLVSIPQEILLETNINPQRRWKLTEKMLQHFWQKWSTDYLQQLHIRSKWNRKTENLKIGDVVLIKEDHQPPASWPMGRVCELHPGPDNLLRVVTLKSKNKEIKRPINKLILLPVEKETNQKSEDKCTTNEEFHKTTKNKQKRGTGSKLMNILLTLLMIFQPTIQNSEFVKVNAFNKNKLVYFDYLGKMQNIQSNWKIVVYYDMTAYWNGVNDMERIIKHVDTTCKQLPTRNICQTISSELQQENEELNHNNYILKSQQELHTKRSKRGLINGVGYLANSLFGVLDERFAKEYEKDIKNINSNEKHLINLIQGQTSILEAHNNILKRHEITLKKNFDLLQNHLNVINNYLSSKFKEEGEYIYFNMIALSASVILARLRLIQEMLLDCVTDIHHGKIDIRLLNQEQLTQEINVISGKLKNHLSLPIENIIEHLSDIYKLMHLKWRVTETYFIVEVNIPLTSDNKFDLYRPISIPMLSPEKKTIKMEINTEILAVNLRREMYMKISKRDLLDCIEINNKNYICRTNGPTNNMRTNKVPCELNTLTNTSTKNCNYLESTCSDNMVKLQSANTWLYHCCSECLLQIICQEQMVSKSITSSGIMKADQDCVIKLGDETFYTESIYENDIYINNQIPIPNRMYEDINNLTIAYNNLPTKLNINLSETQTQLDNMDRKIQVLRDSASTSIISSHDVHQYAVSYTSLFLGLAGALAACSYVHWKRRRLQRHTAHITSTNKVERETTSSAAAVTQPPTTSSSANRTYLAPLYAKPYTTFNI